MKRVLVERGFALRLCEAAVFYSEEHELWECSECGERGKSNASGDGGAVTGIEHYECPLMDVWRRADGATPESETDEE